MPQGPIDYSPMMASISTSPSSLEVMKISSYNNGSPTTTVTTSTNNLASLLRTPSAMKRSDRTYDSKNCMKLTPVNLNCLVSPIRHSSQAEENVTRQSFMHDDVYKENFTIISKQLEKLLEDLNVIFNAIGYSKSEIICKEKLIFNTLSDSINKFFEEAEGDMKTLTDDNNSSQEILNRILEIIHDPSGVQSIPDLYVRNAILIPQSKTVPTSPRKPLSLLSKRKLLKTARKFVYDAYVPKLMNYLNGCIQFMTLFSTIREPLPNLPVSNIISLIPDLDVAKRLRDDLKKSQGDLSLLSKLIKDNNKELLFSGKFDNISNEMSKILFQSATIYKEEYKTRLNKLVSLNTSLVKILNELHIDLEKEIAGKDREIISIYSQITNVDHMEKYVPVNHQIKERLRKLLENYQDMHHNRQENKNELLKKCHRLWSKLKVPQNYIETFLSQNSGLSFEALNNISKELKKLEAMKKKIIKTLVNESWERIEELWRVMQYDHQEKAQFVHTFETMKEMGTSLEDDERLLEVCEKEICALEEKLAVYAPVCKLIEEFKQLQSDKRSLEESSKDSSRLLLRNSHKILLQEEKTRKRITRHFPRVIEELKQGLLRIDELFGKPIMSEGQKLIEIVTKQGEELMSKYPRSRINSGLRKTCNSSLQKNTGKILKPRLRENPRPSETRIDRSISQNGISETDIITFHQTPKMKKPVVTHQQKQLWDTVESNSNCTSVTRNVSTSSPSRPLRRLLPPKVVSRKNQTKIPELKLKRHESSTLDSSPLSRSMPPNAKVELIRPTRMFPISPNRINRQRSQIPMFSKVQSTVSDQVTEINEKENIIDSTPRLETNYRKEEIMNFSSPYREPNNSVYKISVSPNGKCMLNIGQENIDSAFEDTSIMDVENDRDFLTWKNEQILKINEQPQDK